MSTPWRVQVLSTYGSLKIYSMRTKLQTSVASTQAPSRHGTVESHARSMARSRSWRSASEGRAPSSLQSCLGASLKQLKDCKLSGANDYHKNGSIALNIVDSWNNHGTGNCNRTKVRCTSPTHFVTYVSETGVEGNKPSLLTALSPRKHL